MDRDALRRRLDASAHALRCALTAEQGDRLLDYLALLVRWNTTYNLTAIREPERMLVQHLVDCLAAVTPLRCHLGNDAASIADVGSGGGLPGVVLAIAAPEWSVTCIDRVGKKAAFVQQVQAELSLGNLRSLHVRAEDARGSFDVVTSRAYASLADFVESTRHLLSATGTWLALKGRVPVDELRRLPAGAELFHVEHLQIPDSNAERCLVWVRREQPAA